MEKSNCLIKQYFKNIQLVCLKVVQKVRKAANNDIFLTLLGH